MVKKKLFLHIGYHKTGTTSIQYALSRNRDELLKHGYLYPRSGEKWNAHHNLIWQIQETKRYDQFKSELGSWTDLNEEALSSPAQNIIVSSEDFCNSKPSTIEIIEENLRPFDVKIIVYLRRQDLYLQSKWIQIAKLGMPLPEFPEWVVKELERNEFLNYGAILERWAQSFGRENIRVRPFEKEVLGPGLIVDFLHTCDLKNIDWFQQKKSQNISPSVQAMSLIREISKNLPNLTGLQVTNPEFKQLMARTRNLFDLQNKNKEKINLITEDLHKSIMSGFDTINNQVAQTYLGREELFLEPFILRPISVLGENQLDVNVLEKFEVKVLVHTFKKIIEKMDKSKESAAPLHTLSPIIQPQPDEIIDYETPTVSNKKETNYQVIVYQMGKVASTSIVESLDAMPGIEAYQSHFLGADSLHGMLNLTLKLDVHPHFLRHQKGQIMMNIDLTRMVMAHLEGLVIEPKLGIVSLTRNPIDWFRSQIVQQSPAYLDGFAALAGLNSAEKLTSESILVALEKIKENIKETIQNLSGPIDLELSRNFHQKYIPMLKEQDSDADIYITHFRNFLRPFLWFPKMVTSVFDLEMDDLNLNNQGYQLIQKDWGFFYLFRYEDLLQGFNRLVKLLDCPDVSLSQKNISEEKIYSSEIKQAFADWKADEELKKLIKSDYTQRFGYE